MVNATTGVITTVAGTAWSSGDSGDNGPATSATLNYPVGLAFYSHGNLYISENGGNRIRMVATGTGTITTVAGTGTGGFSGDSGVPTAAELNGPGGLAFDHNGNLYVADGANNRIREITPNAGVIATGTITTVAGGNNGAYNGDGIAATTAYLNYPYGVAVDASGNIYIADTENHRIRKITKSTGLISTIAGTGTTGDSASTATSTTLATSVEIGYPNQVALDSSGNVYFADNGNNRVDEVAVTTGYFSVVAGNGQSGFNGNGPAIGAELNSQAGVVVDGNLNVFIADSGNSLIREVAPGASTQTATPYFSVAPGPVNSGQTVEILDATPSAVIYYTTDGSTPTTSSPVYSAPIAINKVMTINAIAQASGLTVSLPASGAYTIILPVAATPVLAAGGQLHLRAKCHHHRLKPRSTHLLHHRRIVSVHILPGLYGACPHSHTDTPLCDCGGRGLPKQFARRCPVRTLSDPAGRAHLHAPRGRLHRHPECQHQCPHAKLNHLLHHRRHHAHHFLASSRVAHPGFVQPDHQGLLRHLRLAQQPRGQRQLHHSSAARAHLLADVRRL